jgi:isopentenyldiphosphate isomerase
MHEKNNKLKRQHTMTPETEYLDVVDANGLLTGHVKLRSEVHRNGDWHKTVHVWLMNNNHELLLQLRANNKESFPGCWDISCAGHRCAGETAIQAALHEASEELGILLAPENLEYQFSVKNSAILNNNTFFDNEIADVFLAHSDAPANAFTVSGSEVAQVCWLSVANIKSCIKTNRLPFVPHTKEYEQLFLKLEHQFNQTT